LKRKYLYIIFILTTVFCISQAGVRYSAQPPFNYTGADGSTCAQCHGNFNTGTGSIITNGLPDNEYSSGQEYNFSITLSHPAGRGRWGFSIAARDANNQPVGSFSDTNPNAGLNDTELSHLMAVFSSGTTFTYDYLKWTAPINPTTAQKTVTFYYIGNAANGDRGPGGDFIYSGTKSVVLASNQPPVVTITSPAPGRVFAAGDTIVLNAAATDADGFIRRVIFYNNRSKLLEDSIAPYGLTSDQAEPGNYSISAKAFDNTGDSTTTDTVTLKVTGCIATSMMSAYGYANIPGTLLADLTNNPAYPASPSLITQIGGSLEYASVGDNYGARLRGFICAPQTGNYIFYIAGDDQAALYLSSDEDTAKKVMIAYNETAVGFHEWTKFATQKSAPVRLVKGARYYFETLHKQGTGADHLSVGWVLPDGYAQGPIPGNRFLPWQSPPVTMARSQQVFRMNKTSVGATTENKTGLAVIGLPNPTTNYFSLQVSSSNNDPVDIIITDIAARVVERIQHAGINTIIRAGQQLRPGIYFVEVKQHNTIAHTKLIKQ
jgi:hypothetical protein